MTMIRKQVYIKGEQDAKLKRLARRLGVSEAELIRRGIDLVTDEKDSRTADEAWQRLLAIMRQRAESLPRGGGTRKWSREEIYDERLKLSPRR